MVISVLLYSVKHQAFIVITVLLCLVCAVKQWACVVMPGLCCQTVGVYGHAWCVLSTQVCMVMPGVFFNTGVYGHAWCVLQHGCVWSRLVCSVSTGVYGHAWCVLSTRVCMVMPGVFCQHGCLYSYVHMQLCLTVSIWVLIAEPDLFCLRAYLSLRLLCSVSIRIYGRVWSVL